MLTFILILLSATVFLGLATLLVCFFLTFYSPKRKLPGKDEYDIPKGEAYAAIRDDMVSWTDGIRNMPHKCFSIKSRDGLTLRAKYYEYDPAAPIELLCHGYRGYAERDLCGGVFRCFGLKRNALLIDHRASGESDGHVITFGIREHLDLLDWIDFAIGEFGAEKELYLGGISMGAATVLMASGCELPSSVKGIVADCGYTSPKKIIKKVIKEDLHLPDKIFYPLVRLSGIIFGGFDVEESSPLECVGRARVPIIFFHGTSDGFVPDWMCDELFAACTSKKAMVKIDGADHGLAYPKDKEKYISSIRDFQILNDF